MKDVTAQFRSDCIRMENPSGNRLVDMVLRLKYNNKYFFDFDSVNDVLASMATLNFKSFDLGLGRPTVVYGWCDFPVLVRREGDRFYFSDHTGELEIRPLTKEAKQIIGGKDKLSRFTIFDLYLIKDFGAYREGYLYVVDAIPDDGKNDDHYKPRIIVPDFLPDDLILPNTETRSNRKLEEILV